MVGFAMHKTVNDAVFLVKATFDAVVIGQIAGVLLSIGILYSL
jgi:hypothetical protein